jgi:acyl-CoA synthetase (AMP-forming)/AMP-acid ligase II
MRLIEHFDRGADRFPGGDCVHDLVRGRSYAEVRELTHRVAVGLLSEGLGPDRKVAIYSPNDAVAYAVMLGVQRAGCVWVTINPRNAVDENLYILEHNDAELVFLHPSFAQHAERIRSACPKVRRIVRLDGEFEAWLAPHRGLAPDPIENPDATAILISSGGTTGRPKGVMLTQRNFEAMIGSYWAAMRFEAPPVHLIVAPITHAAGAFAWLFFPHGGTQVLMSSADPEGILSAIERMRVTHLFLPPTLIYMLLAHPCVREFDYSSLRTLLYGAAPMSSEKLREAMDVFGPVLAQTYGQAEAPMVCTYMSPEEHVEAIRTNKAHRLLSCGRPAAFTRLAVMDDSGRLLPPGEPGEIVVRGALVMKGYYKNPEATAEASLHGWHHTGDIGRIDEDGFVYIVDRKKDMIISGGFNVYPSEVEQVVWTHPAVQDCAVIGVPDEKWGEAVKAVVELKPGASATAEELIALCKEKLGSVKAPKSVEFWDRLPRSAVGKVLKRDIRKPFWQGRERQV